MMVAPQTRVWAIASRPGRNGRVAQLRDHLVGDADRRGLAQLDSVAAAARGHKSSVLPGGPEDQLAPPDVRKTVLLAAVLAVVFGIKEAAATGLSWPAAAAILGGLAVGVGFARRQLTLADPMIDLRLFRTRAFNASLAANLLGIFIVVGYFLFVAQYLQLVLGLSPLEAGLWSLPSAGGFIIGSNLAPRLLRRVRPAYVIGSGLALAAAGLAVLTRVGGSPGADLGILAGGSLLISLGLAPVFTVTTDLVVSSAPPERAGAASGISETGAELGGALGIAVLGSIGVAIYRGQLAGALPPGIPSQATAAAQDTLGRVLIARGRCAEAAQVFGAAGLEAGLRDARACVSGPGGTRP